jgi:hypothetical protein
MSDLQNNTLIPVFSGEIGGESVQLVVDVMVFENSY